MKSKFPIKFVSDGQGALLKNRPLDPHKTFDKDKKPLIEILGRSRNPFYKRGSWSPKAKLIGNLGLILFWLMIISLPGRADAKEIFSFHGYYKLFFTGIRMPTYRLEEGAGSISEPALGAVNNRLRLKTLVKPNSWLTLEAAYDISPRIQDPSLFNGGIFYSAIDPLSYRAVDFAARLYPREGKPVRSLGVFHNLDRLLITIKTRAADIYIGRQAIAWGSAHFINPTDVIAPYTFNELDTEERQGVDALRVRIPLGKMDELDMGYIPGKDFKFSNTAFYMRGKTYLLKTDAALMVVGFRESLLIGMDLARSIGGAGAWIEAAYVIPDFFKEGKTAKNYARVSLGMDYNFSGNWNGFFEYHYNSPGKKKPAQYSNVLYSNAFLEGASYLMGQHYLAVGATYQMTPLIPLNGMIIINFNDGSMVFSPGVEYNIAENIYLSAGAYLGIGKKPGLLTAGGSMTKDILFHSEFGAYPAIVYTSFRIYF